VILDKRHNLLASLRALPGGFEPSFWKTLPRGVAFHHAGLTTEERELVAQAYDEGVLKVMVATCSLAAGINLPARRVILNGARMGRDLVGPAMLRQMRGRAGRKGKDEVGETYLCCQKKDLEAVAELLEAELPPIDSCLTPEKRGVTRALLEIIGTRMASSRGSVDDYVHASLLWHTMDRELVSKNG
jgi:DNA polymerase theta